MRAGRDARSGRRSRHPPAAPPMAPVPFPRPAPSPPAAASTARPARASTGPAATGDAGGAGGAVRSDGAGIGTGRSGTGTCRQGVRPELRRSRPRPDIPPAAGASGPEKAKARLCGGGPSIWTRREGIFEARFKNRWLTAPRLPASPALGACRRPEDQVTGFDGVGSKMEPPAMSRNCDKCSESNALVKPGASPDGHRAGLGGGTPESPGGHAAPVGCVIGAAAARPAPAGPAGAPPPAP